MKPLALAVAVAALFSAGSVFAAAEDADVFARIVVAETELRAGPGISHRVIHRAKRGDAFLIQTRETSGYWLEVLLPDGRNAFVLGDTVEAVAVDDDSPDAPSKPGFFAPPALQDARGGLASTLNVAPSWAIAPFFELGIGGVHEAPKDANIPTDSDWFHARAGAGLLVSLRFRILLRLQATNFVLYAEDRYRNVQSYVGGLGSYF